MSPPLDQRRIEVIHQGVPRLALRLQEAAEACGVEEQALRAAMYWGDLAGKRTSRSRGMHCWFDGAGRYLIPVAALQEWLDSDSRFVPADGAARLSAWLAEHGQVGS